MESNPWNENVPRRFATMVALVALASPAAGCAADTSEEVESSSSALTAHGSACNPGIIPPGAKYKGLTYSQWEARWWRTALATPIVGGNHPLFSGGAFGGDDRVLFLTGVGGGTTIPVTVPKGTALFFPVINAECSVLEPAPFHGTDDASMRACANGFMDRSSARSATIDGKPVANLDAYRIQSPLFTYGPLPADNFMAAAYGDPTTFSAGATSKSVDAGYYLLVAPLSPGKHTIHFGGTFDDFGFSIDTTYAITVSP